MEPNANGPDSSSNGSVPSVGDTFNLNNKPDTPPTFVRAPEPIVIVPTVATTPSLPPAPQDQDAAQFRLETQQNSSAPATGSPYSPGQASVSGAMSGVGAGLPVTQAGPEIGIFGSPPSNTLSSTAPTTPHPGLSQQLFASDPAGADSGFHLPAKGGTFSKRKLILGGAVCTLVLVAIFGYIFGFYLPNKPANVFQTGLSRSGENLTKLVNKFTEKAQLERIKNSEITATLEATENSNSVHGSLDVKLAKTKSDGSLDVRFKSADAAEKSVNLKFLTDLPDNKTSPNIYFRVEGLKALGLDAFAPDILAFDGKWIAVESDYLEKTILNKDTSQNRQNVTSEEITTLTRTVAKTTNEYLLTGDKNKAVLENKSFVGKEKTDGIDTYHYQVVINKTHAREFCKTLTDRVISDAAYQKFLGLTTSEIADQKKSIDKECGDKVDQIKDDMTMDLWIDAKYKLIHKLRVYDSKNKATYTDIGQIYTGGDNISFFISNHQDDDKSDAKFTIDVDTKNYTSKGSLTWGKNKYEPYEIKINFEAKPYSGEVKADKPAGAINFQDVLNALGFGSYDSTSSAPSGSMQVTAKDIERQTDIKALHGQIEAYYAQYGFYPNLANLNSAAWRTTNMKRLDSEALRDPDGSSATLAAKATSKQYGYAVSGCTGPAASECQIYTLTAILSTGLTYEKVNLN